MQRSSHWRALMCLLGCSAMQCARAADPNATSDIKLDEIVVTAQKRSESLQSVPLSATVTSGAALTAMGAISLRDLTTQIPDVHIVNAGASDRLYIRGIGSGDNFSFDQSVGTFVDGIYHGRSRASGEEFLDIDRIEFLKGPQSVFFGNSAIAGAINVTTRKPTDTLSGDVSAAYNFDWRETVLEAAVGGPISSTLKGRIATSFTNSDGWLRDGGTGERVPQLNNKAFRGQLAWDPNEALTVNLKAEAGRFRQVGGILIQLVDCPPKAPFTTARGFCPTAIANGIETQLDDHRDSSPGQRTFLNNEEYVASVDYRLSGATLTSLTGYLTQRLNNPNDPDGPLPFNLFAVAVPESYQQVSQEFRVTSNRGSRVDYLAGLYFQNDHLATEQDLTYSFRTPTIAANPAFAALIPYLPLGEALAYRQTENIYSAFGSATFHVSDSFRIVGGLRATVVTKDADKSIYFGTGHSFNPGVAPFPASLLPTSLALTNPTAPTVAATYSRTDRHASPSVNFEYDLAPGILAYASYANGFKAGGFNGQDTSPDQTAVPFGPEKVNAYELGLKSEILDHRMIVNAAIFRSDYSDLQVGGARPFVSSPAATVQNAGGARSQGIEISQRWAITRELTSSLEIELLDAKYTSYPNANPTSYQAVIGIARQDLTGARTPYSPKYSGTWNVNYAVPLSADLDFHIGGALYFTSRFNMTTNNDPFLDQAGYAKLDANVGISNTRNHWDASLLVRNVTDRLYAVYGAAAPTSLGSYSVQVEPPRSFTAQLRWHF